jgi:hypothetical protein
MHNGYELLCLIADPSSYHNGEVLDNEAEHEIKPMWVY